MAFILLPCSTISRWNLVIKKIQFGIPITIINGGIKAMRIDRLKPNIPMVPSDQITATKTTMLQITTMRMDLKNMKIRIEVTKMARPMKIYISSMMRLAITTRICGSPAKRICPKYASYSRAKSSI